MRHTDNQIRLVFVAIYKFKQLNYFKIFNSIKLLDVKVFPDITEEPSRFRIAAYWNDDTWQLTVRGRTHLY